jgi:hypothetical protein
MAAGLACSVEVDDGYLLFIYESIFIRERSEAFL